MNYMPYQLWFYWYFTKFVLRVNNMKESEAFSKWCPFVRMAMHNKSYSFTNRGQRSDQSDSSRCISSRCMAWADETLPEDVENNGHCGLVK